MMKLIKFECPRLSEMYPDGIRVPGDSAAAAIAMLEHYPGFETETGERLMFTCPDFQSRDALRERTDREVIILKAVPNRDDMIGSGGKIGGIFMMVIGVVLIVFAPYIAGVVGMGLTPGAVATAGAMLALQGLVAVLAPQPAAAGIGDQRQGDKSEYLPANKNTVRTGTRIALILGRTRVYGHFISFNVTATNLNDPSDPAFAAVQGALEATANSDYDMTFQDWTWA